MADHTADMDAAPQQSLAPPGLLSKQAQLQPWDTKWVMEGINLPMTLEVSPLQVRWSCMHWTGVSDQLLAFGGHGMIGLQPEMHNSSRM